MEDYYPSEIARLVLGYLAEVKCSNTYHTFLEESEDLREHSSLLKQKKRCSTNVRGESLLDIFKAYTALKSFFEQIICQNSWKEVLEDIIYLQEHYYVHKQKAWYSTQKTSLSVINSLREWILKISDTNSSGSHADQFVCAGYPQSFISSKNYEKNASYYNENFKKNSDKSVQTELSSFVCPQKSEEKSKTQFVDTSEKNNECPENNVTESTSDHRRIQIEFPLSNSAHQSIDQISEINKNCITSDKHSPSESLSVSQPPSLLTTENDGRSKFEKNKSSQEENLQVKRNLFKETSLQNSLSQSEAPLKFTNTGNVAFKEASNHFVELSEVVKPSTDKAYVTDSEFSSNIYVEGADVQNQILNAEKNGGEYTVETACNLSTKEAYKQISDEVGNSATNICTLEEVPSDNNSSFINSEHDLIIIENELDCHVIDNEPDINDTAKEISVETPALPPINDKPLEFSSTENESVTQENNKSSQKELLHETCSTSISDSLSTVDISCSSVKNSSLMSSNAEINDKIEKENSSTVKFSNEINCQDTTDQSEVHGDCKTNEDVLLNDAVKSINDFVSMNNSQYSTTIPPPTQSSTVLSYTTVPEFTMPTISSDLSGQNIQYQILLNTPVNFSVPSGLSLLPSQGLSFLPLSNVSNQTVIATSNIVPAPSVPSVPKNITFAPPPSSSSSVVLPQSLPHGAKQATIATANTASANVSNIANFEVIPADNHLESTKSDLVMKTKTDFKKKSSSKQKKLFEKQLTARKDDEKDSKSTTGKRPYSKRQPKRKILSLFESSSKPKKVPQEKTPPVLSISDSSNISGKSPGSKIISKITDEFEENYKSPVLKLLMDNAKFLKPENAQNSSHVRCLDFSSKSTGSDEILIVYENNELQKNDNKYDSCKSIAGTLIKNELENEKCTSTVIDNVLNYDEDSKKETIHGGNCVPCSAKTIKSQQQNKKKSRTDKRTKIPKKSEKEAKNVKNSKPVNKASKIQKRMQLQESDTLIQNEKKTSPKKNVQKYNKFHASDRSIDVAVTEENNISPSKSNKMHHENDGTQANAIMSVFHKKNSAVKTHENFNKIKQDDVLKEDAVKEMQKKDTVNQNKKIVSDTFIDKSLRKIIEVQNVKCSIYEYDSSPRKSQRIINKMSVASSKACSVCEKKEPENKSENHYKNDATLDNNLTDIQQNAVSKSSQENKAADTISKNHLSPEKNKDIKCKYKQNIESPRKSDRLQNKKADIKNTDKSFFGENSLLNKNENLNMIEENVMNSETEKCESFKVHDKAAHSIIQDNTQEDIDFSNEINTSLNKNKILFQCTNNQVPVSGANSKVSAENQTKCIAIKNSNSIALGISGEYIDSNNQNNVCLDTDKILFKDKSSIIVSDASNKTLKDKNKTTYSSEKNSIVVVPSSIQESIHTNNKNYTSVHINEMSFKDINDQVAANDVNNKILKDKNETGYVAENKKKHSQEEDKEALFLNTNNIQEQNDINKPLKECNVQCRNGGKNDKTQSIQEELLKKKKTPVNDAAQKSQNEHSIAQEFSANCKLSENNKLSNYTADDKSNKNTKKTVCKDAENSDFSKSIVFGNKCELEKALNNNKNLDKETGYYKCDDGALGNHSIKLKKKVVFNDPNFKLQEKKENKQIYNDDTQHENMMLEKDISKANSSQESEENLKDIKTSNAATVNPSSVSNCISTSTNLREQKYNKEFGSNANMTNKRKMTHPKKMIRNNYLDDYNEKDIQDSLENKSLVAENEFLLLKEDKNQPGKNISSTLSINNSCKKTENASSSSKYDVNISENTNYEERSVCNVISNDIDSAKRICLSQNPYTEQSNIDLAGQNSSGSFHSISSSDEESSSSKNSFNYDDAAAQEIPQNITNINKTFVNDKDTINSINKKRKSSDYISVFEKIPEKCESLILNSPFPSVKRICRKLSSSSDEMYSSFPENKSKEQKETLLSNEECKTLNEQNQNKCTAVKNSTIALDKAKSLQLFEENVVNDANLNTKLKTAQDSPIRCVKKVKKISGKTALSKKIEKDPRIPPGVKIPYRWSNSKLITYSNEICQSTKNTKKNVNKNTTTEMTAKGEISAKRQISKSGQLRTNDSKRNISEKIPEDGKSVKELRVVLNKLPYNNKMQCISNFNTEEKNSDQNILLDAGHEKITKVIPENDIEMKVVHNPNNVLPQNVSLHSESTRDMVEKDIGRSNDEGSELSIAIKNCEKELSSTQSIHPSYSPEKHLSDQPEKNTSHLENSSVGQVEIQIPAVENKLELIRSLVEKYGTDWLLSKLDDIKDS